MSTANMVEGRSSVWKMGAGVFLRSLVAVILAAIVFFAFGIIFNGIFSKNDGYQIVEVDENEQIVRVICTVKDADPETLVEASKLVDLDHLAENQRKLITRTEMSSGARTAMNVVASVFMLALYAAFSYSYLWKTGDSDRNLVNFKHFNEDILRGWKVGLISRIPMTIFWLMLIISKASGTMTTIITPYRLCNFPFLPIMNVIAGGTPQFSTALSWDCIILYGLMLLYIPAVCFVGYVLGYHQYSFKEHLTYEMTSKEHLTYEMLSKNS